MKEPKGKEGFIKGISIRASGHGPFSNMFTRNRKTAGSSTDGGTVACRRRKQPGTIIPPLTSQRG